MFEIFKIFILFKSIFFFEQSYFIDSFNYILLHPIQYIIAIYNLNLICQSQTDWTFELGEHTLQISVLNSAPSNIYVLGLLLLIVNKALLV